jgi:hypothetical protein
MTEFPKRVLVPFWTCPKGHQHKTKKAAKWCMDDAHLPHALEVERAAWSRERGKKALALRREGLTFSEIATRLVIDGIPPAARAAGASNRPLTTTRVSQIVREAEREERMDERTKKEKAK